MENSVSDIVRKLLYTPFLPLLFISKAIEEAVYWQFVDGTAKPVVAMGLLGIVSLLVWVYLDEVVEEATETLG